MNLSELQSNRKAIIVENTDTESMEMGFVPSRRVRMVVNGGKKRPYQVVGYGSGDFVVAMSKEVADSIKIEEIIEEGKLPTKREVKDHFKSNHAYHYKEKDLPDVWDRYAKFLRDNKKISMEQYNNWANPYKKGSL